MFACLSVRNAETQSWKLKLNKPLKPLFRKKRKLNAGMKIECWCVWRLTQARVKTCDYDYPQHFFKKMNLRFISSDKMLHASSLKQRLMFNSRTLERSTCLRVLHSKNVVAAFKDFSFETTLFFDRSILQETRMILRFWNYFQSFNLTSEVTRLFL